MKNLIFAAVLSAFLFFPQPASAEDHSVADYLSAYEAALRDADADRATEKKSVEPLPGGRVTMTGNYRVAGGIGDDFILNDADVNRNLFGLQGPNYRYLFGERQMNTYDPAIYSRHVVNIDMAPSDRVNIHTQIVNDPWSLVGTTGEQIQASDTDGAIFLRYNLKYFGAFNSVIGEVYRSNIADRYNFPTIKAHDGHTTGARVEGFDDFDGIAGNGRGIPFTIPELDIDYEYRPIRKLWMDYKEDDWNARLFALADESQALTTDDPLGLSNHKDYWEASPWLYQYEPAMFFTTNSMKRGYYSDSLAFLARDSSGNRLILLKGASLEGKWGPTQLQATVASPQTPWQEHYFDPNNIPGAARVKHDVSDALMVGGTYTFRNGLIDDSIADASHVGGVDFEYKVDAHTKVKAQAAASHRSRDLLTDDALIDRSEGYAFKAMVETGRDRDDGGRREMDFSFTHMDKTFQPVLSHYLSTRDDKFWANHIHFSKPPGLEPFRIGDGIDVNRYVFRFQWREAGFKDRFYNLFDVRNVHKARNSAVVETVFRDEATYKFTDKLTGMGLFRWRALPRTTANVEPALTAYYFPLGDIDPTDFTIQNIAVREGQRADQFTYSTGLQYVFNPAWTGEGVLERTNAVPDFPRGLAYDFFKDANERVDGILIDRVRAFLYGQRGFGAEPRYKFFNIYKGRLIHRCQENLKLTLHGTQNNYRQASGIDDNITHLGLSTELKYSKNLSFFGDYTYSKQVDLGRLIESDYQFSDYRGHHNIYGSMDYHLSSAAVFRAEYGVFGFGSDSPGSAYSISPFSLPTLDTEHLLRLSLSGEF